MLKELKKMGKKVIAMMFNGRPMALADVVPNCDALVEAWHLGIAAGDAICDVLFGDYDVGRSSDHHRAVLYRAVAGIL